MLIRNVSHCAPYFSIDAVTLEKFQLFFIFFASETALLSVFNGVVMNKLLHTFKPSSFLLVKQQISEFLIAFSPIEMTRFFLQIFIELSKNHAPYVMNLDTSKSLDLLKIGTLTTHIPATWILVLAVKNFSTTTKYACLASFHSSKRFKLNLWFLYKATFFPLHYTLEMSDN